MDTIRSATILDRNETQDAKMARKLRHVETVQIFSCAGSVSFFHQYL